MVRGFEWRPGTDMAFWLAPDPVVKETMERKRTINAAHWTQDKRLLLEKRQFLLNNLFYVGFDYIGFKQRYIEKWGKFILQHSTAGSASR